MNIPHPNLGRSGAFTIVLNLLEKNPEGLTTSELERTIRENGLIDVTDVDGRAVYYRVKRALDGLQELGYIEALGRQGREGVVFKLVPGGIEKDLKEELKRAMVDVKKRMGTRFQASDADQLLAAFDGALDEVAEELGVTRRSLPGTRARAIKKGKG